VNSVRVDTNWEPTLQVVALALFTVQMDPESPNLTPEQTKVLAIGAMPFLPLLGLRPGMKGRRFGRLDRRQATAYACLWSYRRYLVLNCGLRDDVDAVVGRALGYLWTQLGRRSKEMLIASLLPCNGLAPGPLPIGENG
jgi:hypothetical protein